MRQFNPPKWALNLLQFSLFLYIIKCLHVIINSSVGKYRHAGGGVHRRQVLVHWPHGLWSWGEMGVASLCRGCWLYQLGTRIPQELWLRRWLCCARLLWRIQVDWCQVGQTPPPTQYSLCMSSMLVVIRLMVLQSVWGILISRAPPRAGLLLRLLHPVNKKILCIEV